MPNADLNTTEGLNLNLCDLPQTTTNPIKMRQITLMGHNIRSIADQNNANNALLDEIINGNQYDIIELVEI